MSKGITDIRELKRTVPVECRFCGEMIQFMPDPRGKKGQFIPYTVETGELHLNTCKKKHGK